jgi:hypothetical protein
MALDLRVIRIGIEVLGRVQWYDDPRMNIKASGTKYANPLQNDCTVVISGLSRATRDYILSETSPFNNNRTPKRLIVQVGRVTTGVFRLFVGDMITAEPGSPPEVSLTLKAKTQNAQAGNIVSNSGGATSRLSGLAAQVARDIGVSLDFQAQDKNIANYAHTGAALRQVQKLQEAGGVSAYIDDDVLVVKDAGRPLSGRVQILNLNSGLVGVPKATEKGLTVQFLVGPETALGGALRVESKFNKAVNGDYVINQLAFDVQSHGNPFFYTALCTRL